MGKEVGKDLARGLNKLSASFVTSFKIMAGRHSDGGGLYLNVTKTGTKSWVFMWVTAGKRYEMGLGSAGKSGKAETISLKQARDKAQEIRDILGRRGDPFMEASDRRAALEQETFGSVANAYISVMKPNWSNPKHTAQWEMTLGDAYCLKLRKLPVQDVNTEHVLEVLTPIWQKKPETSARLRGRIEKVLDYAKAKGWRSGENPARWKGHLKNALPTRKRETVKHHDAMDYKGVPEFYQSLSDAMAARALRFLILTASRSNEVLGARWEEFDLEAAVWTVPKERMKAREEHRVPLSPQALLIIKDLREISISSFVFFGQQPNRPLSNMSMEMLLRRMKIDVTVHGFRSSFRDWSGDATNFSRDIAEAALAHAVGNKVEAAYRRSDALEKRRKMMEAWGNYCSMTKTAKVINLRRRQ